MFCPYCGKENKSDTKFCGTCGKVLTEKAVGSVNPEPKYRDPYLNSKKPVRKKVNSSPARAFQSAPKIHISKDTVVKALLIGVQGLFYIIVPVIMILLLHMEDTITVNVTSGGGKDSVLCLNEMLSLFINGNDIFNPTVASTAIGVGAYILIYSLPVFAIISLISLFLRKNSVAFKVLFTTMSLLTATYISAIVFVSTKIIPELKNALAYEGNILVDYWKNLSATTVIVFAVICVVLAIGSNVISGIANKRGASK